MPPPRHTRPHFRTTASTATRNHPSTVSGLAHPALTGYDVYAAEVGDDNADGVITEDESGWSCVDNGNRVCGPGNPHGVPAGRYDEGGVLVDPWPVDGYAY
jgi:hypothetical protein